MKIKHLKIYLLILLVQSCAVTKHTGKEEANNSGKAWGIDISHYQEITDWTKLKTNEPNFIFVKATEGSTIQDPKYPEYYKTIRNLGIPVGSYHFFTYKTSGKDQANNFLATVKYQRGDLPLVLDAEFAKTMPDKEVVAQELLDFMTIIRKKKGHYPIIYCPYKYYLQYLKNNLPKECRLWIVDYKGSPGCNWTFWQTTEKYTLAGIKGYVDFNLFSGTPKELKNLLY